MHLGGLCLHHLGVSHLLCIYMWHPMSWQHLDLVRICHVAEASRVLRPMSWHRILCRIIAVKMLRPMSWHCSAATCLCNRTSSSGHNFQKLTIQRISKRPYRQDFRSHLRLIILHAVVWGSQCVTGRSLANAVFTKSY